MNLSEMRTTVRRDLKDEDASNYRWTNDELDRHIAKRAEQFLYTTNSHISGGIYSVLSDLAANNVQP